MDNLGTNIKYRIDGDKLTLEVDLSKRFGKSASGKTTIIASSGGNQDIGDGIKVGLNIYTK
jgi:hypothetical protein